MYTTVKPPAFDPSVAPPKIFAKYAPRKGAVTPGSRPGVPQGRNERAISVV